MKEHDENGGGNLSLRDKLSIFGTMVLAFGLAGFIGSLNPLDRVYAAMHGRTYTENKQKIREGYIEGGIDRVWSYDFDNNGFIDKLEYRRFIEDQYDKDWRNK